MNPIILHQITRKNGIQHPSIQLRNHFYYLNPNLWRLFLNANPATDLNMFLKSRIAL